MSKQAFSDEVVAGTRALRALDAAEVALSDTLACIDLRPQLEATVLRCKEQTADLLGGGLNALPDGATIAPRASFHRSLNATIELRRAVLEIESARTQCGLILATNQAKRRAEELVVLHDLQRWAAAADARLEMLLLHLNAALEPPSEDRAVESDAA